MIRFWAFVSTSSYQIDPATSTISVPTCAGKHQISIASNEFSDRFPRVPPRETFGRRDSPSVRKRISSAGIRNPSSIRPLRHRRVSDDFSPWRCPARHGESAVFLTVESRFADSDEVARLFRFVTAHLSDFISPVFPG
jgi:hypothetical protein